MGSCFDDFNQFISSQDSDSQTADAKNALPQNQPQLANAGPPAVDAPDVGPGAGQPDESANTDRDKAGSDGGFASTAPPEGTATISEIPVAGNSADADTSDAGPKHLGKSGMTVHPDEDDLKKDSDYEPEELPKSAEELLEYLVKEISKGPGDTKMKKETVKWQFTCTTCQSQNGGICKSENSGDDGWGPWRATNEEAERDAQEHRQKFPDHNAVVNMQTTYS